MMNIYGGFKAVFFFIFVLFLSLLLLSNASLAESFFLSAEEAVQLQLSDAEWAMPPIITRGSSTGPFIDFQAPPIKDPAHPTLETASPLSLIIFFQKNSAPVDMSSLEIIAKKGFFKKNLTERVKPYVQGTTLKALELEVPKGKFKIQIIIADIKGNQTSVEYRLLVGE